MREFQKMLFSKVVPNCKRLGLLTPWLRERFHELDILKFEHEEASALARDVRLPASLTPRCRPQLRRARHELTMVELETSVVLHVTRRTRASRRDGMRASLP